ncbi:MAG: hypothetical protein WBF39_06370 [Planococcus donghaensis]
MRRLHVLALLLVSIIFAGCSSQGEIIRVGEPTVEDTDNEIEVVIKGHEITNEISDESNIEEVKKVVDQIDSIERPDRTVSEPPETFFELYESDNSVSVFQYYLWMQPDGGAILMDSSENFFEVDAENTTTLKEALE